MSKPDKCVVVEVGKFYHVDLGKNREYKNVLVRVWGIPSDRSGWNRDLVLVVNKGSKPAWLNVEHLKYEVTREGEVIHSE